LVRLLFVFVASHRNSRPTRCTARRVLPAFGDHTAHNIPQALLICTAFPPRLPGFGWAHSPDATVTPAGRRP
jgi:hypothetical protein